MNDADLFSRFGKHTPNSFGEAFEVVGGRDQNVLDASGFQVGQHAHPKRGRFIFAQPQSQNLFFTVSPQAYSQLDRLVDDFGIFPDFEHDTVHPNDAIDRLKRPVLPGSNLLGYALGDPGDGRGRDLKVVEVFDLILDVADAHSFGIERDDDVFYPVSNVFPLGDKHWLKGAVPVSGHLDFGFSVLVAEFFLAVSISGVSP